MMNTIKAKKRKRQRVMVVRSGYGSFLQTWTIVTLCAPRALHTVHSTRGSQPIGSQQEEGHSRGSWRMSVPLIPIQDDLSGELLSFSRSLSLSHSCRSWECLKSRWERELCTHTENTLHSTCAKHTHAGNNRAHTPLFFSILTIYVVFMCLSLSLCHSLS